MGKIMLNGIDYSAPATSGVSGVKGAAETAYRTGNVNLTPENIGALKSNGDSKSNTTTFTSADTSSPTSWTDVSVLTSGSTHATIFNKVSTMFKNLRWVYKKITEVQKSFEWTALTSKTGASKVTLPSAFNELLIKVNVKSLGIILSIPVAASELYDTSQAFRSGWFQNGENGGMVSFSVSKSSVELSAAYLNSADVASATAWVVYYR